MLANSKTGTAFVFSLAWDAFKIGCLVTIFSETSLCFFYLPDGLQVSSFQINKHLAKS
jgi:hypothetical protein